MRRTTTKSWKKQCKNKHERNRKIEVPQCTLKTVFAQNDNVNNMAFEQLCLNQKTSLRTNDEDEQAIRQNNYNFVPSKHYLINAFY